MSTPDDGPQITRRERLLFAGVLTVLGLTMVAASCVACGPTTLVTQTTMISTQPHPAPAVTRLFRTSGGFTCTAWKVATPDGPSSKEDLLATAGHCCMTPWEPYHLGDPKGPEAFIAYDDDDHDVCILRTLRGGVVGTPIQLAAADPDIGDVVWTAGFPHGVFLISDGYWSGRVSDDSKGVCSSTVGGGASGSPILNTRGEAVGVLIERFGDMDSLTFVAPIEWLRVAVLMAYAPE